MPKDHLREGRQQFRILTKRRVHIYAFVGTKS